MAQTRIAWAGAQGSELSGRPASREDAGPCGGRNRPFGLFAADGAGAPLPAPMPRPLTQWVTWTNVHILLSMPLGLTLPSSFDVYSFLRMAAVGSSKAWQALFGIRQTLNL